MLFAFESGKTRSLAGIGKLKNKQRCAGSQKAWQGTINLPTSGYHRNVHSPCAISRCRRPIETLVGRSAPAIRRLISFLVCDIPSGRVGGLASAGVHARNRLELCSGREADCVVQRKRLVNFSPEEVKAN